MTLLPPPLPPTDPRTQRGHCGRWASNDPVLRGLTCECQQGPVPALVPVPEKAKRTRKRPRA